MFHMVSHNFSCGIAYGMNQQNKTARKAYQTFMARMFLGTLIESISYINATQIYNNTISEDISNENRTRHLVLHVLSTYYTHHAEH